MCAPIFFLLRRGMSAPFTRIIVFHRQVEPYSVPPVFHCSMLLGLFPVNLLLGHRLWSWIWKTHTPGYLLEFCSGDDRVCGRTISAISAITRFKYYRCMDRMHRDYSEYVILCTHLSFGFKPYFSVYRLNLWHVTIKAPSQCTHISLVTGATWTWRTADSGEDC